MNKINEEQLDENKEEKSTLTKDQLNYYHSRLRHYLSAYELEEQKTGYDVAKELEYTPQHYSKLKSFGTSTKFHSCLLFLSNISSLKKLSLTEFMSYIENIPLEKSTKESKLNRDLHGWEHNVIKFYESFNTDVRRIFTRISVGEFLSKESKYFQLKCEVASFFTFYLLKMKKKDLLQFLGIVREFLKHVKIDHGEENLSDQELAELSSIKEKFLKDINMLSKVKE